MKTDENKMNPLKVRKLLITGMVRGLCEYNSRMAEAVLELYEDECSIEDIMEELQLSRASVYSYIPYKRVLYAPEGSPDAGVTADRIRLYRQRQESVMTLSRSSDRVREQSRVDPGVVARLLLVIVTGRIRWVITEIEVAMCKTLW